MVFFSFCYWSSHHMHRTFSKPNEKVGGTPDTDLYIYVYMYMQRLNRQDQEDESETLSVL